MHLPMIRFCTKTPFIIHRKTDCKMNCSPQAYTKATAQPVQFAPGKRSKMFAFLVTFFLICSFAVHAQQTVTGRVTSGDSALSGVSVVVKNTTIGTSTNGSGNFTIKVPPAATLVFSYIGYADQEVTVGSQTTINVNLSAAVNQMND